LYQAGETLKRINRFLDVMHPYKPVKLAAFDIGSGATKLDVALVDQSATPWKIVGDLLYSEQVEVLLAHDLKASEDNTLSVRIMDESVRELARMKQIAETLGVEGMLAIGTAVFRLADNGMQLVHRIRSELGLKMHVISQDEEGRLGYLTAATAAGASGSHLVAWDSGGASFQMSMCGKCGISVYEGPLGTSLVTAMLVEEVQQKRFSECQSPNPVTLPQVHDLVAKASAALPEAPFWLTGMLDTLHDHTVIGIGGATCIFLIASMVTGTDEFTPEEVFAGMERLVGSTDEQLSVYPQPDMVIPKLALMYTVMKHVGARKVKYLPANGSCRGVLTTAWLWDEAEIDGMVDAHMGKR